jgi:chorismate mutase-like protein
MVAEAFRSGTSRCPRVRPVLTLRRAMSDDPLVLLRERISTINLEVLELLNERMRVAEQIRSVKQERGLALFDPQREAKMLEDLEKANRGPLPRSQIQALFKQIFALSLSHMEETRLGSLRVHRQPGQPERHIDVRGRQLGGGTPCLIAGPCAVETAEQIEETAARLSGADSCAEEHSSRARAPIRFRGWGSTAGSFCGKPPTITAWRW